MKKELKYYMNLKYKIELTPLSENQGGDYEATIPQLGKYAFVDRGRATDWKSIIMSVFERSKIEENVIPYAAVFLNSKIFLTGSVFHVTAQRPHQSGAC